MKVWERYIETGNYYFSIGQWHKALDWYANAINYMDTLYRAVPNCDIVITAWVTGYHNLANTYQYLDNIQRQEETLYIPYNQLIDRLKTTDPESKLYGVLLHSIIMCYDEVIYFKMNKVKKENKNINKSKSEDAFYNPMNLFKTCIH